MLPAGSAGIVPTTVAAAPSARGRRAPAASLPGIGDTGVVVTETSEEPTAPPPSRRGRGTVLDMVRSMAVVLLLVGAVALITFRPSGGDAVRVVDYADDLGSARLAAPYAVLAPAGLDGYRATSVRFSATTEGTVWHLGFVTPLDEYAGLDQTDGPEAAFVDDLTEGAEPVGTDGSLELGGRTWERWDDGGDTEGERIRGLVSDVDGATVVVSGTADWPELEALASALVPE